MKKADGYTREANLSARISTKPMLVLLYYSVPGSILLLGFAIGYVTHYLIGIAVIIILLGLVTWGISVYTRVQAEKSFEKLRKELGIKE